MMNRIKAWLLDPSQERPQGPGRRDEARLAAAALMFETARMDEEIDPAECERIEEIVRARFGLNAEEAATLRRAAAKESAEAVEWHGFARTLNQRYDAEERIQMIEMLWEVAYADGKLHDLEASLLRRIGGLLYVSDQDRGAARRRVLDRLGITDPGTEV
jgi:uncharacterized tellurite resistance protein B-like protein